MYHANIFYKSIESDNYKIEISGTDIQAFKKLYFYISLEKLTFFLDVLLIFLFAYYLQ